MQFTLAIQQDNAEKLNLLLQQKTLHRKLEESTVNGCVTSAKAVQLHDTARLKGGCEVNKMDDEGRTLLHEAIIAEASNCIGMLLRNGSVNINIPDNQGWTPLFWAINR